MKTIKRLLQYITVCFVLCTFLVSCEKEEKPELTVSSTNVEVINPKGVFTVTSNTDWTLTQSGDYRFSVSPTKGVAGTTEVGITYRANATEADWKATLTITAGTLVQTVTIFQPKVALSVSPNPLEFDMTESTKSVSVTSTGAWNIDGITAPDWIKSISATGTNGNGSISITVKQNTNHREPNKWTLNIGYAGTLSKSVEIIQSPAPNQAPSKPTNLQPANGATDISLMPAFSWDASTDPEKDPIEYYVQLSKDGENWDNFSAGDTTAAALANSIGILEPGTTYYYKVTANDGCNGITDSEIQRFTTTSTRDAYADGEWVLCLDSKKPSPVILVFTGDGYLAEHHRYKGLFDQNIDHAIEAFFDVEPYRSYKEYFRVYKIAAYSKEAGLSNKKTNEYVDTAFDLIWEGGNSTGISMKDDDVAFEWCSKIPELKEKGFTNACVSIISNANVYAGTCVMYSDGRSVAMTPYKQGGKDQTEFANTLRHEMGGHGFGRLGDEYRSYNDTIPKSEKASLIAWQSYGVYLNVSAYPDIEDSPWAHFAGLEDYSHVRMYEGAYLYTKGVWRPEMISCMHDNRPYYNTPSRFYIVKRILEIAGEVEPFKSGDTKLERDAKIQAIMDIFLPKDVEKSDPSSVSTKSGSWQGVPYDFIPLGKPILKHTK